MDADNSTGTRTARTSTKFKETATERDIKCRAVKKLNKVNKITQIDNQEQNIRKYLYVKIQNKKVKMQLDSGSDISIINTQTRKNIGKPTLLKSNKIARTETGRKINFVGEGWQNIHFNDNILKK